MRGVRLRLGTNLVHMLIDSRSCLAILINEEPDEGIEAARSTTPEHEPRNRVIAVETREI